MPPPPTAIYTAWTPAASLALFAPESMLEVASLDHLMGYFSYSRGFRGGGFNGVIDPQLTSLDQFKPESLNSYEVGFKTIGFDQRATLNISVFYGDYQNIQVTTQREIESDTGVNIGQETTNAAEATQKGAEVEFLTSPIEGLRIEGSIGLLYTKYDKFESFSGLTGAPLSRAGESFDNAPEFQAHLALQYSFPLPLKGDMAGWLTPRIDWSYQSSFHVLGPEITSAVQEGFNLLHARLAYSFMDDRAQVALWGQNLLNVAYFDMASPVASSFGYVTRYYQAPRTFGGELSYSF
jgi:iron complex outermembrane receptor protein